MSNFAKVIASCRAATGAGSKKVIQQILQSADETARHLICLALDPYTTFGVKQFDRLPSVVPAPSDEWATAEFISLLNRLDEREITGDAAREAVSAAIANFDADTAEYMALVIDKDLRAGFSADSANKAWKDQGLSDTIPTFEVMLADKCEDASDFDKYVTFPCQADWKYDGCLSASWKISLKDGREITIGEFVDLNLDGEVLSYNTGTKKKEWKKIIAKIKNSMPERSYEWFKIILVDGTELPPLTGNHRVWLPELKCWRRVDELSGAEFLLQK